ncbi:hypothetical protein C8R43DRAFT_1244734 [Mycena crocata]|nr:hypothetical protein C8R43DRAFT_1244734 [Mycena crocata]
MPSIVTANLVEALLEAFLCGGYIVLSVTVLYLFHRRHGIPPGKGPALWVLLGLIAQSLSITAHLVLTIYRNFFAILGLGGGSAAELFYNDISTPTLVSQFALTVICSVVTDVLVIHRLYVIYSYNRRVIICPIVFLVGRVVCGAGIIAQFGAAFRGEDFQQVYSLSNGWVTCGIILSILISAYSTGMIWRRISRIHGALSQLSGRISGGMQLTSILAIIVESAALQTSTAIGILVTFHVGFVGQVVWTGCAAAILGISTLLIHARIGLGWAHEPDRKLNQSAPTRINLTNAAMESGELELEQEPQK